MKMEKTYSAEELDWLLQDNAEFIAEYSDNGKITVQNFRDYLTQNAEQQDVTNADADTVELDKAKARSQFWYSPKNDDIELENAISRWEYTHC